MAAKKTTRADREREQVAHDRMRAEVYVLEGTIATLLDDVEGWHAQKYRNDPVPLAGQLVCADVARELVTELTGRLKRAKAAAQEAKVELWDPLPLPNGRRDE